jgi:gliding motility-associated-like protein
MRTLFYILLVLLAVQLTNSMQAQGCAQAGSNVLCAETGTTPTALQPTPFSFGCFSEPMSFFYSFHTSSDPSGQVSIQVSPTDCDNFLGPDAITVVVVEWSAGVNPCDPIGSPFIGSCQSASGNFTAAYSGLNPNSEYLLILGSPHDTLYGPCETDISISGPGVDISASVSPLVISLGESADLQVIGGTPSGANPNAAYVWSPSGWLDDAFSDSPVSTPEETVTYTVTSTVGSCTQTDNITVTVGPPIVIYNAFTPNADGFNDLWEIPGIQRFENVEVNVYDRWGQNVFRSIGYATPWDGTFKGRKLPTGAYYYSIELNDLNVTIPPYNGVISIVN